MTQQSNKTVNPVTVVSAELAVAKSNTYTGRDEDKMVCSLGILGNEFPATVTRHLGRCHAHKNQSFNDTWGDETHEFQCIVPGKTHYKTWSGKNEIDYQIYTGYKVHIEGLDLEGFQKVGIQFDWKSLIEYFQSLVNRNYEVKIAEYKKLRDKKWNENQLVQHLKQVRQQLKSSNDDWEVNISPSYEDFIDYENNTGEISMHFEYAYGSKSFTATLSPHSKGISHSRIHSNMKFIGYELYVAGSRVASYKKISSVVEKLLEKAESFSNRIQENEKAQEHEQKELEEVRKTLHHPDIKIHRSRHGNTLCYQILLELEDEDDIGDRYGLGMKFNPSVDNKGWEINFIAGEIVDEDTYSIFINIFLNNSVTGNEDKFPFNPIKLSISSNGMMELIRLIKNNFKKVLIGGWNWKLDS